MPGGSRDLGYADTPKDTSSPSTAEPEADAAVCQSRESGSEEHRQAPEVGPSSQSSRDHFSEPPARRSVSVLASTGQIKPHQMHEENLESCANERVLTRESTRSYDSAVVRQCTACGEDRTLYAVAEALCGHTYCGVCVEQLMQTALDDYRYLPCRCYREPIPFAVLRLVSPDRIALAYEARLAEQQLDTSLHCFDPTCLAPIPQDHVVGATATCPKCSEVVCMTCRGASHRPDTCPDDPGLNDALAIALGNHWQQCFQCRQMVEKSEGCNHITSVPSNSPDYRETNDVRVPRCLCSAQFCYLCGAQWKTCGCAQMDQGQLNDPNHIDGEWIDGEFVPIDANE